MADSGPGLGAIASFTDRSNAVDLGRFCKAGDNAIETSLVELTEGSVGPEVICAGIQVPTFTSGLGAECGSGKGQNGRSQKSDCLDHLENGKR